MSTRRKRYWLWTSIALLLVAVALGFFDRGLTRLLIPLNEPRAVLGLLVAIAGYFAFRGEVAGSKPRRIAGAAVLAGSLTILWALVPFWRLASSRTVRFTSEGAELVGTWLEPRSPGQHGAIVVVHGSGSMTRRVYRAWAEPFLHAGFGVLIYDKRGVGDSKGLYEERHNTSPENILLLAKDAAAALRVAAQQPSVDRARVGYFGVSQAGWIVPRALQLDTIARFAVLLGGAAVSVGEQNYFNALAGDDHLGFRDPALPMAELEARVRIRKATGFDPRSDIGSSPVPILWLYGSLDTSTPALKSIAVLDSLKAATSKALSYRLYDGANHVALIVRGPGRHIPPQFVPGLWDYVINWIPRRYSA
jgi:dienelactone hydrolase